jgi:hypothetical protein
MPRSSREIITGPRNGREGALGARRHGWRIDPRGTDAQPFGAKVFIIATIAFLARSSAGFSSAMG